MRIRLATESDYFEAFGEPRTAFGTRKFLALNRDKVEAVRFFIGCDEKDAPRLGIALGYDGEGWSCPFSAPFGEIAYRKPQSLERIYDFISELAETLGHAPLRIVLAPALYDPEMLPKMYGVLANYASKTVWNYNFHYDLDGIASYRQQMDSSARNHFNRAMCQGFEFAKTDDLERAYRTIRANREAHGYYLSMTLDQVREAAGAVRVDCFVMTLQGEDVASAIIYHTAPGIVQVVYWGDAPGYLQLRPMNIFPYYVFKHYAEQGLKTVDAGTASTNGIPNPGLCQYKEAVGCRVTIKPTFEI